MSESQQRASEVHQRAKEDWMRRFEGARITKVTPIGSPTMRHFHRRQFDHVGRNCHFITVFGRILLGEDRISDAEDAVTKRIDDVMKAIERKVSAMTAIVAEAKLDVGDNVACFNRIESVQSDIVVPAQTRFLTTILLGDKYLILVNTLWLHGQLDSKAKSRAELELKQLLRSIPSTTRKMRIYLQTKVREDTEKTNASPEAKKALHEAETDLKMAGRVAESEDFEPPSAGETIAPVEAVAA